MILRSALKDVTRSLQIFVSDSIHAADIESIIPDLFQKVSNVLFSEKEKLPQAFGLKFRLKLDLVLQKYSDENREFIENEVCFSSNTKEILMRDDCYRNLDESFREILSRYDTYVHAGSGWSLQRVRHLTLEYHSFPIVRGGCDKAPLPKALGYGVLCIKDCPAEQCFLYAVAAGLVKVGRNPARARNQQYLKVLKCLPSLSVFPVSLADVKLFEKRAPQISINVYGYDKTVFPFYVSQKKDAKFHVNLLLHQQHYYTIRNLAALVKKNVVSNTRKTYVCTNCLAYFCSQEKFELHNRICSGQGPRLQFPSENDKTLFFNNFANMIPSEFTIYCDLETLILKEEVVNDKKLLSFRKHVPIAAGGVTTCYSDPEHNSPIFIHTGKDCISQLFQFLQNEVNRIDNILTQVSCPLEMTPADWVDFNTTVTCRLCSCSFNNIRKVRDHNHISGAYRAALCNTCNITYAKTKFVVNIFFHGLSNYDSHFLIQELHKYIKTGSQVRVIPKSSEKYLSFAMGNANFKDSIQFLNSSLAELVKNLRTKGARYFKNVNLYMENVQQRNLFFKKGIYPYSYMDCIEKLEETSLPAIECFKNDLTGEDLSPEDYQLALDAWNVFECRTMKDYMEAYLKCDILLLADVFENFRANSIQDYQLDPSFYLSTAHFTLDAFLKMSRVTLDLILDVNQYLFLKNGIRGGMSMVVKRFSRANHPYLQSYDPSKPIKYILYLDANNLYGKAMMERLPTKNFEWMSEDELNLQYILGLGDEGDIGCIVECDMLYPQSLHSLHEDYPLAPEKCKIHFDCLSPVARGICEKHNLKKSTNSEKLMTTFFKKERYVLHYKALKLYLDLGLKVTKVHMGIKFIQEPIIKNYIEFNSMKRAEAQNTFDSNYYKLLSNSLFGKTIERPENRVRVVLSSDPCKHQKVVGNPCFKTSKIINDDLVASTLGYAAVKVKKPFYIGMTILELAKVHMYNFHYRVMKNKFGDNLQLLYTDTDSLLYEISDENMISKLGELAEYFDFSNYPSSHCLYNAEKKKVPGYFKDEAAGEHILEFVGLRSKMYSFVMDKTFRENKTAKGVKKSIISRDLQHADYLRCLKEEIQMEHTFNQISSKSHSVTTNKQKKISLSPFDDKRYLIDKVNSLPYGSVKILTLL